MSAEPTREPITPDLFQHLVHLAALELPAEESEYLRKQLNNQLNAIRELQAIPLEGDLEVTSHGVSYPPENSPAIRPDVWTPFPDPDRILAQAPEVEDRYIVVPDIPHTDLK